MAEPITTSHDADRLEAFMWRWYDQTAGPGEEWVLRDLVDALMESAWLAEHDREVSAKALLAASEDVELALPWDVHGNVGPDSIKSNAEAQASAWLEDRARALSDDAVPGGAP